MLSLKEIKKHNVQYDQYLSILNCYLQSNNPYKLSFHYYQSTPLNLTSTNITLFYYRSMQFYILYGSPRSVGISYYQIQPKKQIILQIK
jgi:hypothetical protein